MSLLVIHESSPQCTLLKGQMAVWRIHQFAQVKIQHMNIALHIPSLGTINTPTYICIYTSIENIIPCISFTSKYIHATGFRHQYGDSLKYIPSGQVQTQYYPILERISQNVYVATFISGLGLNPPFSFKGWFLSFFTKFKGSSLLGILKSPDSSSVALLRSYAP